MRHDPASISRRRPSPERSILVAPLDPARFDDLLAIAEPLARRPPRELILAQLIGSAARARGGERACARAPRGAPGARRLCAIAPRSRPSDPARRPRADRDRAGRRPARSRGAPACSLDDAVVHAACSSAAPCDVGVLALATRRSTTGPDPRPVHGRRARLVGGRDRCVDRAEPRASRSSSPGPIEAERDASRLLARASLAVQRALGVEAEPLLVAPGIDELCRGRRRRGARRRRTDRSLAPRRARRGAPRARHAARGRRLSSCGEERGRAASLLRRVTRASRGRSPPADPRAPTVVAERLEVGFRAEELGAGAVEDHRARRRTPRRTRWAIPCRAGSRRSRER